MLVPVLLFAAAVLRCSCIAALLAAATIARAEVQRMQVDLRRDLPTAGGSLALAVLLSSGLTAPHDCEICGAGRPDLWTREHLRWSNPASARVASDVLANGVIPAAALLNSAVFARRGGAPGAFWEDALIISEAAGLTLALNGATKDVTARRRPSASLDASGSADRSFFSGHTSFAFAVATAAGTISSLRGYPSAPWVWAAGMTLASGVGYLRVAGDAHWASDVAVGAAVGGALGFAVPWFFHRVRRRAGGVDVVPAPGGFGIVY